MGWNILWTKESIDTQFDRKTIRQKKLENNKIKSFPPNHNITWKSKSSTPKLKQGMWN
jgi:hypothetical protein